MRLGIYGVFYGVVVFLCFSALRSVGIPYKPCPYNENPEERILKVATCDTRVGWKEFMALKHWNVTGDELRREGLDMRNVCKGENWGKLGFLTKPLIYLDFIKRSLEENPTKKHLMHVILMDSDTFWSASTIRKIWNKYDCARGDKNLVLSTEMSCWVGKYCTADDFKRWYTNVPETPSYSPFVNSGVIMGRMDSVAKMLEYVVQNNQSYFIKYKKLKFDDQYAIADYGINVAPKEVALDYHQQLASSCSIHSSGIGNETEDGWPFACKKRDGSIAPSCPDYTKFSMRRGYFTLNKDDCQIYKTLNDAIPFKEELGSLAPDPVIWHGNGAGKRVYMDYGYKSFVCYLEKKKMTVEDHLNTYG